MQKQVSLVTLAVILLILSALLVIGINVIAKPLTGSGIEKVPLFIQQSVFGLISSMQGGPSPDAEKKIESMSNQVASFTDQKEMQALRDQFEATELPAQHLLPSRIVGYTGFLPGVSRPTEIVLDRGSNDGVSVGLAVVYKEHLVGKVTKVTPVRTRVALLSKSGWSFTGKTGKTSANGLIKIDGGDILLENVVLSDTLEKNDVVMTKGDETVDGHGFPPDIVVGQIVSVDKKTSALFQSAKIKSLIDITKLPMVFVFLQK